MLAPENIVLGHLLFILYEEAPTMWATRTKWSGVCVTVTWRPTNISTRRNISSYINKRAIKDMTRVLFPIMKWERRCITRLLCSLWLGFFLTTVPFFFDTKVITFCLVWLWYVFLCFVTVCFFNLLPLRSRACLRRGYSRFQTRLSSWFRCAWPDFLSVRWFPASDMWRGRSRATQGPRGCYRTLLRGRANGNQMYSKPLAAFE